ncbi:MAG: GAF domain-containing protein [Chloroflexota bacterium]
MSDPIQQPQDHERIRRLRAFWAASLSVLLEGFILIYAVYQLAQVNFLPQTPFGFILVFVFLVAFLLTLSGIILIIRGKVMRGVNLVYYAGFLPAVVTPLLFSSRGISTAIAIVTISLLILFFVYQREQRQGPLVVLAVAVFIILAIEVIDPAYRAELPANTQVGPIVGALFLLAFLGLLAAQEWPRLQIRSKLVIWIAMMLFVILGSLTWISLNNIRGQVEADEDRQLTLLNESYNIYVASQADAAAALAISLADREDVIALFEARDRDGLLELLTPMFTSLKEDFDIRHLYVEEPNGTVFVRVHDPESYGDNITYRRTAADALALRQPVAGVEIGPNRLGVRGVAPMFEGAKFVGMIEVGIDYDTVFIQNLKSTTDADYTMWVTYEAARPAGLKAAFDAPLSASSKLFYYASTYPNILPISGEIYDQVLQTGVAQTIRVVDGTEELAVYVAPMIGYGNRIIGIFEIINSRAATLADIRADTWNLAIFAILIAIVSLGAMWTISQFIIIRPIEVLANTSHQQAAGDLEARVQLPGNDEFSKLGLAFNTLSENLQHLVQNLEIRVSERTADLEMAVEQTNYRSRQLESVAEVANSVATIRELHQLLPRIAQLISERFGYYHAGIFLLDGSKEYAFLTAANSEGGKRMLARSHRLKVGSEGIVGYVTHTGRPRVALDVGMDAVFFNNPDLPETRSEMSIPLRVGEEVIGALDVQSTEAGAFVEDDIEVLTILADQIAIAIENARLFEDSRRLLAETQAAYGKSLQETWKLVNLSRQDVRYDYKGIEVQASRELLSLPEIAEANRTGRIAIREKNRKVPNTSLAVPIKVRNQVVGTINVRLATSRELDPDELDISRAVAERLGIAIEGAMLLEESQRKAVTESAIGDISVKIGAATEMEAIMVTAVSELKKILGASEVSLKLTGEE